MLTIPPANLTPWLLVSMGLHAATLTLWPMPATWSVGVPTYMVVDLRPPGEPPAGHGSLQKPAGENGAALSTPPKKPPKKISEPERKSSRSAHDRAQLTAPHRRPEATRKPTAMPASAPETASTASAVPSQPTPATPTGKNAPTSTGHSAPSANVPSQATSAPATLASSESIGTFGRNGLHGDGAGAGRAGGGGTGLLRATPLGYGENRAVPYPRIARRRGWQGKVLLRVTVSAQGRALSVQLETSSGYDILDHAALQAVADWRFRPATFGGRPRADQVLVPIYFILHEP